jgi:hypothetical protein
MTVDSGGEFTVEVRGAFDDVEHNISAVPTPFTPACDGRGHPLAPIAGPIVVRGAKPGDIAIDLIELTPFGVGQERDPEGFRSVAPRVPGTGGARFAGVRRPRLVRRPHSAGPQPLSARSRRYRPKATSRLLPALTAAISTKRTPARGAESISRFWSTTCSRETAPGCAAGSSPPRKPRSTCATPTPGNC